jgi:lysophospholipase L1-like esterase
LPPDYYGYTLVNQLQSGRYPRGVFEDPGLDRILESNGTEHFRRNLEHIIALARFRDIASVLVTFKHSADDDRTLIFGAEEFGTIVGQMNAATRQVALDNDVPLFDLASVFPSGEEWFVDGVHMNEVGARLKAQMIGEFLVERQMLEPSEPDGRP